MASPGATLSKKKDCACWGVGAGGAGTARSGSGGKKWVISQRTMPAVSLLSTSIYVSKAQDGAHRSAFLLESVYHVLE